MDMNRDKVVAMLLVVGILSYRHKRIISSWYNTTRTSLTPLDVAAWQDYVQRWNARFTPPLSPAFIVYNLEHGRRAPDANYNNAEEELYRQESILT